MNQEKNKKTGEYLKKLREEKNMSQEELAQKLNVERSTLAKWESGKNAISEFYLNSLNEIFGTEFSNWQAFKPVKENLFSKSINCVKKKKKIIAIIYFIITIIIISLLLAYYFINHNSVKIYMVGTNSDIVDIESSFFFRNNEIVVLMINLYYKENEDDIKLIKIYTMDEEEKKYILQCQKRDSLYFMDFNGYNAYVNFKKLDSILNNMFIEIEYKDSSKISSQLTFSKIYSNKTFFTKKLPPVTSEDDTLLLYEKSRLNSKFLKASKLIGDKIITIKYKNNDYEIYGSSEDMLSIKNSKYTYTYINYSIEFFTKSLNSIGSDPIEYTYNISTDECSYNDGIKYDCSKYEEDITLFEEIVDYIIKNEM